MKHMSAVDGFYYWGNRLNYTQSRKVLTQALEFLVGEAAMFARSSDEWLWKSPEDGEWLLNLNESGEYMISTDTYSLKELTVWVAEQFAKAKQASESLHSQVAHAIEEDDFYEDEDFDGGTIRSTYITSTLHVTPSGKYYTPWANSNVNLLEAGQDSLYAEMVQEWMEKDYPDYYLTSGEGDPLDIILVDNRDGDDTAEFVEAVDAISNTPYSWEEDDDRPN